MSCAFMASLEWGVPIGSKVGKNLSIVKISYLPFPKANEK